MASRRISSGAHAPPPMDASSEIKRRGRKPKVKQFPETAPAQPVAPSFKSNILSGPAPSEPGELYFTAHDRLLYENKQYAFRNATQAVALKRLEIAQAKLSAEKELRRLETELASIATEVRSAEKYLLSIQEEIEKTYRVSLKNVLYDADTGRITLSTH